MTTTHEAPNDFANVFWPGSQVLEAGMIADNPSNGTKKLRSRGNGAHAWTEDEIDQYGGRHPIGSKAWLALALLLYTAQRRAAVVKMGWQHVRGDQIAVRQAKTGRCWLVPLCPELVTAINAVPQDNSAFLLNHLGIPFTPICFERWFRARCNEAGLPHCSAHGLRMAAVKRLT